MTRNNQIDLGNEPPITLKGGQRIPFTNPNASLRWFLGTFLTGFTASVLIVGALIYALDTNFSLAVMPNSTDTFSNYEIEDSQNTKSIKNNRKLRFDAQFSSRQPVQINTLKRIGHRDKVISNPFILVTSTLHTKADDSLTDKIPKFNPLKLSQIETGDVASTIVGNTLYDAKIRGNVAISVLDFPVKNSFKSSDLTYSSYEIEELIEYKLSNKITVSETTNNFGKQNPDEQKIGTTGYLPENNVRIETENISFFQKSNQISKIEGLEETYDIFREGDNFSELLFGHGFIEPEVQSIIEIIAKNFPDELPAVGHRLRIAFSYDHETSRAWRPIRVSIYSERNHLLSIALADNGHFKIGEAPTSEIPSDAFLVAKRTTIAGQTPTLYNSIYQTALKQQIPAEVINELIRLYLYELDFNARVRIGDRFQVLYESKQENTEEPPEILYSSLTTGGVNRTFYRYQIPNSGIVDYFDETGKSASKFLVRKPVLSGKFKSGYGMRRHPILGGRRMHNGVDWSAPVGTPVFAAGDGIIKHASPVSGYGRQVKIQHTDGYQTTYSHLQKFSEGIKRNVKVSQGQVIGFVGSTGASTGSHLHYEILINKKYVDPMRIRLPRVQELSGTNQNDFTLMKDRLNNILNSYSNDEYLAHRNDTISSVQ